MRTIHSALLALALAAPGCSTMVDPADIAPVAPATAGALCEGMVATLSSRASQCLGQSADWRASNAPKDVSCPGVSASASAGTIAFDVELGATCLETSQLSSCFELFGPLARGLPAACSAALLGSQATGAPCKQDLECASGYCDEGATCPGLCVAWPAACASTGQCAPGKVCAAGFCQTAVLLGPGALCTVQANGVCGDGLFCDTTLPGPQCVAQRTSGACTIGGRTCLTPGSTCTQGTGEVTPTCKPFVGVGASCAPGAQQCVTGSWCSPAPGGTVGTCVADSRPPASCTATAGNDQRACLGGTCSSGTCVAFVLTDGACTSDAQCGPAGACRAGLCELRTCP